MATVVIFAFLISFPFEAFSQGYPIKPITIYCGYEAGGPMDLTARGLAQEAQKVLGVAVVVENKPGGGSTVAASLLATKNPDGYTLGVLAGGALSIRPHLTKVPYNPLKDFTYIMQYSRYIGSLCVLNESPIKTIDEFIVHAKANPGLSYASPGMYTQQHISIELLSQCKGLKFKHVPYKGANPAITALMGKHTDFLISGGNFPYVRKGMFRMLLALNIDKRLPDFSEIPTLKELGCEDCPGMGMIVVGPKGVPKAILEKLSLTFKQIMETANFKDLLAKLDIPYDYKDAKQMEKDMPAEYEWFGPYLKKIGAKRQD